MLKGDRNHGENDWNEFYQDNVSMGRKLKLGKKKIEKQDNERHGYTQFIRYSM